MDELIIPGVDVKTGVARFAGKQDLFVRMLKSFVGSLPEAFASFAALNLSDAECHAKAQAEAHTMKGTAGNMSVTGLYQAAMAYEHTIKENTTTEADYLAYQAAILEARSTILPFLSAMSSAPAAAAVSSSGTKEELAAIFKELLAALEIYQASTCDKCVEKIKAKSWAGVDRAALDAIYSDISDFEYENAAEKIKKIM